LITHTEPNATLLGEKIIVVCDAITKGPLLLSTKGRHRAQYMVVEGQSKPAYAVIDVMLTYVKKR
jgi:hypothetical protein